jgi:cytoskeleton protein RodZ
MSELEIPQGEGVTDSIEAPASVGAGAMLRSAREAQGLHIEMLAASLKVSVKKIEALESNRFDLLPDMVFVRALASSICRNLKVDERPVLLALPLSQAPKMVGVGDGVRPRFQDARYVSHGGIRKSFKSPWGLALVLVLVAIVAILLWPERLTIGELVTTPPAAAPSIAQAPPAPVSLAASEPAMPITGDIASVPVASAKPEAPASDVLPAPAGVKAEPVALNSGPLKLLATGSSWIEVLDADGAVVFRRTLFQGESTVLGGKLPLSVVLGHADVVSVWVRGQAFDTSTFSKDSVARFQVK